MLLLVQGMCQPSTCATPGVQAPPTLDSPFPSLLPSSGSADTHIFFSLPICASLFGCSPSAGGGAQRDWVWVETVCVWVCAWVCVLVCTLLCVLVCVSLSVFVAVMSAIDNLGCASLLLLLPLPPHCDMQSTGVPQCPLPLFFHPPCATLCGATKRIIKKCLMK